MRIFLSITVVTGLLFAGLCGCAEETASQSAAAQQVVYFDVKSKTAIAAPRSSDVPAVNPKTGKRTLMPALYCAKCQRWHAAPPLEIRQRNPAAGKCPKCQQPLIADGPLPAK